MGNYYFLRDIKEEDLELVLNWRNKDHIREVMFSTNIISKKTHLNWFENLKIDKNKKSKIFIYDKPIGILNISNIDEKNSKCEWGFFIGEENTKKGSGLLLGYLSLNYIFDELNLNRVIGEVIESNIKSRNFHEKLGFKLEGVYRMHIYRNSIYENVYQYGILKHEWIEMRKALKLEIEKYLEI